MEGRWLYCSIYVMWNFCGVSQLPILLFCNGKNYMLSTSYEQMNHSYWIAHQMLAFVFICLTIVQLFMVHYRILQKNIRIAMASVCYSALVSLAISIISFMIPDSTNMAGKLRYILLGTQLIGAYASILLVGFIGNPKSGKKRKYIRNVGIIGILTLALLVLTNDLHMQVFQLGLDTNGSVVYDYRWGAFLVMGVITVLDFASTIILCVKSLHNQTFMGTIWIGIYILIAFVFAGAHVFDIRVLFVSPEYLVWDNDHGLVISMLALFYLNFAMQSGLIPSNSSYYELFEESMLKLVISDKRYQIQFQSKETRDVKPDILSKVIERMPEPYLLNENQIIYTSEIPKGYAFYAQDITEIRKLQKETEETVQKLKRLNEILAIENSKKITGTKNKISMELINGLNDHISSKTDMLARLIKELEGLTKEEDNEKYRWLLLARITLLLVDIKRHCNLFFIGRQNPYMPVEELIVYIDELAEFAGYANIRCMTTNRAIGQIKVNFAAFCYDFFYLVIDIAAQKDCPILIEELTVSEKEIEMHLLISFEIENLDFIKGEVLNNITNYGGRIQYKELDDVMDISLWIPLEKRRS